MKLKFFFLLTACLVLFPACGKEVPRAQRSVVLMDTVITLQARGEQAVPAVDAGIERLEQLDRMLGEDAPESAVRQLNDSAGKDYVKLPDEVWHILEVSQKYSELTHGAWDATMGAAISLWGIGTEYAHVPPAKDLEAVKEKTGWRHLKLRPEDKSAMLEREGMRVHLGGIAKGYALDEMRKVFQQYGIRDGLIDLGASSLYALGKNDKGTAWSIGIRHPRKEKELLAKAELSDEMLSTSGDYERFFEQEGTRYHHILDPLTCRPAENGIVSVTVVVADGTEDAGMLSDLFSTAVFVMGTEKGKKFLETLPPSVSAEITTADGRILTVHGFEKRMREIARDFRAEER